MCSFIRRGALLAALAVLLSSTACTDGEAPDDPGPTTSASAAPSWQDGLSDEQVDTAYEAIDFLHSYDAKIEGFVEVGAATPEAMAYLQDHHAVWRLVWEGLQANEAEGRTSTREPGWDATTTPTEVVVQDDGYALITITRCLDPSKTTDYVKGVEQASVAVTSYEQYVDLQRDVGGRWLISGISADVEASCDLSAD